MDIVLVPLYSINLIIHVSKNSSEISTSNRCCTLIFFYAVNILRIFLNKKQITYIDHRRYILLPTTSTLTSCYGDMHVEMTRVSFEE